MVIVTYDDHGGCVLYVRTVQSLLVYAAGDEVQIGVVLGFDIRLRDQDDRSSSTSFVRSELVEDVPRSMVPPTQNNVTSKIVRPHTTLSFEPLLNKDSSDCRGEDTDNADTTEH